MFIHLICLKISYVIIENNLQWTAVLISCLILLPATHGANSEIIMKNSYPHLYREMDLLQLSAYAKALHLVEENETKSVDKYPAKFSSTMTKPEYQTSSAHAKSLHLEEQYDPGTKDQSPIVTKTDYQALPVYTPSWHLMKQYDPTLVKQIPAKIIQTMTSPEEQALPIYAGGYSPTTAEHLIYKHIPTMRETGHQTSPTYAKSLHFVEQYHPTTADQSPTRIFQISKMTSQPTASYDYLQQQPIAQHFTFQQQEDQSSSQYYPNSGYHYPHPQ